MSREERKLLPTLTLLEGAEEKVAIGQATLPQPLHFEATAFKKLDDPFFIPTMIDSSLPILDHEIQGPHRQKNGQEKENRKNSLFPHGFGQKGPPPRPKFAESELAAGVTHDNLPPGGENKSEGFQRRRGVIQKIK